MHHFVDLYVRHILQEKLLEMHTIIKSHISSVVVKIDPRS